jgi:hypothetical protein
MPSGCVFSLNFKYNTRFSGMASLNLGTMEEIEAVPAAIMGTIPPKEENVCTTMPALAAT